MEASDTRTFDDQEDEGDSHAVEQQEAEVTDTRNVEQPTEQPPRESADGD